MTNEKRVWVGDKPVRGFIGGLFFGLGVALVAHAFKLVPLDDSMFTYFPLGTAVLFAIRARLGAAYRLGITEDAEPPATEPPPPAEPLPET